jgi:hypothetical protein
MGGIPRSLWIMALLTYHGASTIALTIFDWHRCMIAVSNLWIIPSGLFNVTDGLKEEIGPQRMKTAIEATSSKKMGNYKASRVFIICLSPHSSHKIQLLNKAFMRPPKTIYCQKFEKWLRSNPGRFVTIYKTGKLFEKYEQAATCATATNGCRATDVFPFDMNFFRLHNSLWRQGT